MIEMPQFHNLGFQMEHFLNPLDFSEVSIYKEPIGSIRKGEANLGRRLSELPVYHIEWTNQICYCSTLAMRPHPVATR